MNNATDADWFAFISIVVVLFSVDLATMRGRPAQPQRRAFLWNAVWIGAGLAFSVYVLLSLGSGAAQQYLAAYLIEESLSLDNVFIFLLIFQALGIAAKTSSRECCF